MDHQKTDSSQRKPKSYIISLPIRSNGKIFQSKSQKEVKESAKGILDSANLHTDDPEMLSDNIEPSSEQINVNNEENSDPNEPEKRSKSCKKYLWITVGIIVFVTIIVTTAIIVTKSNSNETNKDQPVQPPQNKDRNSSNFNETNNDKPVQPLQIEDTNSSKSNEMNKDQLVQPLQNEDTIDTKPHNANETYDLITLNSTSALCLDGSPSAYYLSRTGDPSKIFLLFQGGGWCLGNDYQETLQDCYNRSKSQLGSSKFQSSSITFYNRILSNMEENYFKDWKKVFILYCDGSGHQGTRKDPVQYKDSLLYFRGHNNTVETFDDLQKRLGLYTKAEKVVVSGESAGAVAMYTWANHLKEKIQHGSLHAIADSGIFYHAEGNMHTTNFKREYANLMNITNSEIDPPVPECIEKFSNQKQNCMFVQNLIEYIQVPLFHIQFVNDIWPLIYVLKIDCILNWQKGLLQCTEEEIAAIEDHRKNVTNVLKKIAENPQNGVWGVRCFSHAIILYPRYTNSKYDVPEGSNFTVAKAIQKWMQKPEENNIIIDESPFSAISTCG